MVFDIGHNTIRAGYAGEDSPKVDIPSTVGVWLDSEDDMTQTRYNIGLLSIHVWRPGLNFYSFGQPALLKEYIFRDGIEFIFERRHGGELGYVRKLCRLYL